MGEGRGSVARLNVHRANNGPIGIAKFQGRQCQSGLHIDSRSSAANRHSLVLWLIDAILKRYNQSYIIVRSDFSKREEDGKEDGEREFVTRATNDVPLARSPVSPFEDPTRRRQVVIQSPNLPAHDFACKPTSSYSHSARDQTAYTATTRRLSSPSALKTIIFSLYLHGTNCTIVTIPCSRGRTINVVEISSNLSSPGDIPTALPADSTNYYYYYYYHIPSSHLVQRIEGSISFSFFFFPSV